ncbi:MAG: SPOR domain-containing protein [Gammaproteobacteria bacterium]|nr:SPOR domain-containing protein [Gammaproteobacteria bacterium]
MAQVDVQDDAEFVLKHRVVGAVILILFAVFVLPFVLRGQDVNGTSGPATIRTLADPDPTEFISKVTPVDADQVANVNVTDDRSDENTNKNQTNIDVQSDSEDVAKSIDPNTRTQPAPDISNDTDDSTKKQVIKTEKKVASIDRGWVVQVATFGSDENANKMKTKLEEKGFSVRTSKIDTANGEATRVWVGPFEQRVSAGRARAEIEQAVGQKGLIMAYP